MSRSTLAFAAALTLSLSLFASDKPDWHLSDAQAAGLFQRSQFAHGYAHGYETGYHHGDKAVHLGMRYMDAKRALKKVPSSVKKGNDLYRDGFEEGFRAGYVDAFAGRSFRAVSEVRSNAAGCEGIPQQAQGWFDAGFRSGYQAATAEIMQTRSGRKVQKAAQRCSGQVRRNDQDTFFCEGFQRGHRLGRSDAEVARRAYATYTASK